MSKDGYYGDFKSLAQELEEYEKYQELIEQEEIAKEEYYRDLVNKKVTLVKEK